MSRWFIVAGLLALAAPTAAQPDSAPPAGQPVGTPPAQTPALPAGVPLSLEEALRAAERASETISVARADVDRARAQVGIARSSYYPQVNGSAGYTRTLATEFDDIALGPTPAPGLGDLPFGQPNAWRLGVQGSQLLFDGFRTRAAVSQARAGVRLSELGMQSTRAQVVLQVAQAYYDAALAQRQIEIAEVTLQQAEETLAETDLKFRQGAAPEFDVVRAQVSRDNQRNLIARFRVQRDVAFVQLLRLVGLPLDRMLDLTTKLETDDVEDVVALARRTAGLPPSMTRVPVEQAKEAIVVREAIARLARAELLPVISAGTDFGIVNYEGVPFNTDWRTNWTVGINLSLPIFDGFRRYGNIKSTKAELAAAREDLAATTEVSQVEIAQAAANVTASQTTLETSRRTVEEARRAYEIAELRFEQGASTHLELIDARVQLENAQLNVARSSRDLRVARLRQELLPGLPLGSAGGF